MCVMSMIVGHFQDRWPNYQTFPLPQYPDYSELVRKARLYDEMMKQKDCPDPAKEAWHDALEKFMRERYKLEPAKETP